MRRALVIVLGFCVLLVVVIGVFVVRGRGAAGANDANAVVDPATEVRSKPVRVIAIALTDFVRRVEATGEVRAVRDAVLAAEQTGRVVEVLEEGTPVRAGQVIARLEADRASATTAAARARVAALAADESQRRADVARMEALAAEGAVSAQDVERARAAFLVAAAHREAGEADARAQGVGLGNLAIRAPFAGVILKREVEVGEIVSPGMAIVRVGDPSMLEVVAALPEADAIRVDSGDAAWVSLDALPGESFPVRVERVDRLLAVGTRTARVTLRFVADRLVADSAFNSVDRGTSRMPVGALARVILAVDRRPGSLVVPVNAIRRAPDGDYAWVVKNGRANLVRVTVGERGFEELEIRDGLAPGDHVVILGGEALADGDAVAEALGVIAGTAADAAVP